MLIIEIALGVALGLGLHNVLRPYWMGIFSSLLFLLLIAALPLIGWLCYVYWDTVAGLMPMVLMVILFFIVANFSDWKNAKKIDYLLSLNSETQLNYHTNALLELLERIINSKFAGIDKSKVIFEYEDENFSSKVKLLKFPFRNINKGDVYVIIKNKSNKSFLSNSINLNSKYASISVTDTSFHKSRNGYLQYSDFIKSLYIELNAKYA